MVSSLHCHTYSRAEQTTHRIPFLMLSNISRARLGRGFLGTLGDLRRAWNPVAALEPEVWWWWWRACAGGRVPRFMDWPSTWVEDVVWQPPDIPPNEWLRSTGWLAAGLGGLRPLASFRDISVERWLPEGCSWSGGRGALGVNSRVMELEGSAQKRRKETLNTPSGFSFLFSTECSCL